MRTPNYLSIRLATFALVLSVLLRTCLAGAVVDISVLKDSIAATTTEPEPKHLAREVIQNRQTTSKQIRQRRHARQRLDMVKRNDATCQPVREIGPSSKPYPTCPPAEGTRGYARYPYWDLYRDDLPGNPIYPADRQESSCFTACNAFSSTEDTCVGVVWSLDHCYLKGAKICDGYFTTTSTGPQSEGAALSLLGDCAKWAQYVPAEMDAVCCNS